MTSDSANTVHVEEMVATFSDCSSKPDRSDTLQPKIDAITSRKRPVPAAHLSFIAKFSRSPEEEIERTLASWPPMSMTVRTPGKSFEAPLAWHDSSDIWPSVQSMRLRP